MAVIFKLTYNGFDCDMCLDTQGFYVRYQYEENGVKTGSFERGSYEHCYNFCLCWLHECWSRTLKCIGVEKC